MDLEPSWLTSGGRLLIEIGSSDVYPEDSAADRRNALKAAFDAAGLADDRALRMVLADAMLRFAKEFYL
jgi:hypothetical protein